MQRSPRNIKRKRGLDCYCNSKQQTTVEETKCNGSQQHRHHTQTQAAGGKQARATTAQLTAAFKEDGKQRGELEMPQHVVVLLKIKTAPVWNLNYFAKPAEI